MATWALIGQLMAVRTLSGVANLAGAPFFDLQDQTVDGDPSQPKDVEYVVPNSSGITSGTDDIAGDG
ncbi:MAG: hypothetical protein ACK5HY_17250 [Parahaliea sp.]